MSSTLTSSEGDEYSKYSAFDEAGNTTLGDSTTFAMQSKTAAGSISLADVKFGRQRVKRCKNQRDYSRDEFLYALSSPSSIGAMAWIVSSFVSVLYGSSIVVYLNFCIPLFLGPYVIREQMPAQLLPSVRRKFYKLRSEANALSVKNVQLKGTVSRMQRQEYRLSAVEERFEHLCQRSEKDIVKMKQLARKNAALRQKIKVNLAAEKLQELLTNMEIVDFNGNRVISEKNIDEVVSLMKAFAGKNASSKFDKDAIHTAVVNSMAKSTKIEFITNSKSDIEYDNETRDSAGDYDGRKMYNMKEGGHMYVNEEETEETYSNMDIIARPSQQSHEGKPDNDTQGEESWAMLKKNDNDVSLKLDPSGHLNEKQTNIASGTVDRPIDIEKLLFHNHAQKQAKEKEDIGHHYSHNSNIQTMISPIE